MQKGAGPNLGSTSQCLVNFLYPTEFWYFLESEKVKVVNPLFMNCAYDTADLLHPLPLGPLGYRALTLVGV